MNATNTETNKREEQRSFLRSSTFTKNRYGPVGYTFGDIKFLFKVIGSYSASMLFLQNIFPKLIPRSLFPNLFKFFQLFPRSNQLEWNSRILSSVNALLISTVGLFVLHKEQAKYDKDLLFYHSKDSQKTLLLFLGYLIYDLFLIIIHHKQFPEKGIIFHHLLFITMCGIAGYIKFIHGIGLLLTMNEISTPSLNIRWHLLKISEVTSLKWEKLELFNMLMMYIGFLFFRVIPNTNITWKFFNLVREKNNQLRKENDNSDNNGKKDINIMKGMTVMLGATTSLNWYWFYLINNKAWEMISSSSSP